jgi:hypothetical protein
MSGLIASRLAAVSIVSAGPFVGALDGATVGADEAGVVGVGDALLDVVGCALGFTDGELDGAGDDVGVPDGCDVGIDVALGMLEGIAVGAGVAGEPPPPEHALKSALASTVSPVVDRRESKDHPQRHKRRSDTSIEYSRRYFRVTGITPRSPRIDRSNLLRSVRALAPESHAAADPRARFRGIDHVVDLEERCHV